MHRFQRTNAQAVLDVMAVSGSKLAVAINLPSGEDQPLPTYGILVAITVMNRTFASRGRLAM